MGGNRRAGRCERGNADRAGDPYRDLPAASVGGGGVGGGVTNLKNDKSKLEQAARAFGEILGRHTLLYPRKDLPTRRARVNGWSVTVANLNDSVSIGIYLDKVLGGQERSYWVGFASTIDDGIDDIVRWSFPNMSVTFSDKYPDPPKDLTAPTFEKWHKDGEYFGIYSESKSEFDSDRALAFVQGVLGKLPDFENSVKLIDLNLDIAAIERDESRNDTTKKQLIDARIGQGKYRRELEGLWDKKCAVLGVANPRVLRASHVKPWKFSSDEERLDPHNGLLLTAHLDALFDANLITFSSSGKMILANDLLGPDRKLLNLGGSLSSPPSLKLQRYLKHHREAFKLRQRRAIRSQAASAT